ncbi:MAG: T9SS type A sorting domain-containing protein, partial [Flavobacteriales bacterium]|nr:T9SS type A sorting domain-containing protein [Flavobacteriales bacterium]
VLLPHPQPANDRAWVPVPGSTTDLDLFDATGQHVRSVVRTDPTASHLMVTTDALPSGLYLVRASARGQVLAHGRLIVTH